MCQGLGTVAQPAMATALLVEQGQDQPVQLMLRKQDTAQVARLGFNNLQHKSSDVTRRSLSTALKAWLHALHPPTTARCSHLLPANAKHLCAH
eukprot:1968030-Amphidinium_carterae.2